MSVTVMLVPTLKVPDPSVVGPEVKLALDMKIKSPNAPEGLPVQITRIASVETPKRRSRAI
jgi:hypothetical protein